MYEYLNTVLAMTEAAMAKERPMTRMQTEPDLFQCINCCRDMYPEDMATCDMCGVSGCEECVAYYEATDRQLCEGCRDSIEWIRKSVCISPLKRARGSDYLYTLQSLEQGDNGPELTFVCGGMPNIKLSIDVQNWESEL